MRNRGVLAICASFVLVGSVLVMPGGTATGLMSVFWFGFGGPALLAPALSRRGGAVRIVDVRGEPAFLVAISRVRQAVVVVAAFGMAAGSALLALVDPIVGALAAYLDDPARRARTGTPEEHAWLR